jgi:hypothetical protein
LRHREELKIELAAQRKKYELLLQSHQKLMVHSVQQQNTIDQQSCTILYYQQRRRRSVRKGSFVLPD